MATLIATFKDISGEKSTVAFPIADQIGATTMAEVIAFGTSLETALEGISLLTLESIYFRQSLITEDPSDPASQYANRENAARLFWHNNISNEKGNRSVPGPDLDNVARAAGSDLFDLTDTEMAALVSWIETNVEYDGEPVTVDRAQYVGRNN
jgi:hypothetical protein